MSDYAIGLMSFERVIAYGLSLRHWWSFHCCLLFIISLIDIYAMLIIGCHFAIIFITPFSWYAIDACLFTDTDIDYAWHFIFVMMLITSIVNIDYNFSLLIASH